MKKVSSQFLATKRTLLLLPWLDVRTMYCFIISERYNIVSIQPHPLFTVCGVDTIHIYN